jgi:hypothetical protein
MNRSTRRSGRPARPASTSGACEQREFNLNADFVYRLPVGTGEPVEYRLRRRAPQVETYAMSRRRSRFLCGRRRRGDRAGAEQQRLSGVQLP